MGTLHKASRTYRWSNVTGRVETEEHQPQAYDRRDLLISERRYTSSPRLLSDQYWSLVMMGNIHAVSAMRRVMPPTTQF